MTIDGFQALVAVGFGVRLNKKQAAEVAESLASLRAESSRLSREVAKHQAMSEADIAERIAAEAALSEAREVLRWVAGNYLATLAGRSVRDADECLEAARVLSGGGDASGAKG